MATKFASLISNGNSALARRAGILETQAKIAQQAIVDNFKKEKANLEIHVMNLTDFAPESKDSLRPGSESFNPDVWAEELQNTKFELWKTSKALKIAEDTFAEFFTETE